jgi:hypothetical protein
VATAGDCGGNMAREFLLVFRVICRPCASADPGCLGEVEDKLPGESEVVCGVAGVAKLPGVGEAGVAACVCICICLNCCCFISVSYSAFASARALVVCLESALPQRHTHGNSLLRQQGYLPPPRV